MKIRWIVAFMAAALLSGCEACRPYAHADREGYSIGIIGTWAAVAQTARNVIDPDAETLTK